MVQSGAMSDERTWPTAVGLLFLTLFLSVSSAGVLVAFPFLALTVVFGLRRLPAALAAMLAVIVTMGVPARGGVWYLERGWAVMLAGWFVALTLQWPRSRFFPRAFGAVAGTAVLVGLLFMVRPGSWSLVSWLVVDGMMRGVSAIGQVLMAVDSEVVISTAFLNTLFETEALRGRVFPALLGLSSLSGLAVAWWAYVRLSAGSGLGLGPLRDFRFNDHLVWLLLTGLGLVVFGGGEGWTIAGSNAVLFMGALYALRGAAVLLFLNGGLTTLGFLFLAVGMLLLWPVLIPGVLVVGVGDTWLDLRSKAEAIARGKS